MSGSSPCRLTMQSASRRRATSATRSVPLAWSRRVISTRPPKLATAGGDARIVGGDDDRIDAAGLAGALVDVLDEVLAGLAQQRLAGQAAWKRSGRG